MDIYYYTVKLHDFLIQQGILKYLVHSEMAYSLNWCFNRVRSTVDGENVRRQLIEPVYTIGQEDPVDYVLCPGKEVKPEELFEVVIWGNDKVMDRLRGIYIDLSRVNDEWKNLVSETKNESKAKFKSIW